MRITSSTPSSLVPGVTIAACCPTSSASSPRPCDGSPRRRRTCWPSASPGSGAALCAHRLLPAGYRRLFPRARPHAEPHPGLLGAGIDLAVGILIAVVTVLYPRRRSRRATPMHDLHEDVAPATFSRRRTKASDPSPFAEARERAGGGFRRLSIEVQKKPQPSAPIPQTSATPPVLWSRYLES